MIFSRKQIIGTLNFCGSCQLCRRNDDAGQQWCTLLDEVFAFNSSLQRNESSLPLTVKGVIEIHLFVTLRDNGQCWNQQCEITVYTNVEFCGIERCARKSEQGDPYAAVPNAFAVHWSKLCWLDCTFPSVSSFTFMRHLSVARAKLVYTALCTVVGCRYDRGGTICDRHGHKSSESVNNF